MTIGQEELKSERLVLGWNVNAALTPRYWMNPTAKAGLQADEDLIKVPAELMGCHTAIIAQSGSGKSFFLGRLVEELALRTKARCVILDSNADFRRVGDVVESKRWTCVSYDNMTGVGLLPHEASREEFAEPWSRIKKRVLSRESIPGEGNEQLRLPWTSLSIEFLGEEVAPMLRSDLYHCHEFVKALANLLKIKYMLLEKREGGHRGLDGELIEEGRTLLARLRFGDSEYRKHLIEIETGINTVNNVDLMLAMEPELEVLFSGSSGGRAVVARHFKEQFVLREVNRAAAAVEYISPEVERYYFGKAAEYTAQGIVETRISRQEADSDVNTRIDIIDLPSFQDVKTTLLALNSVLSSEWERARSAWSQAIKKPDIDDQRVPTFMIIDEAHNFIPTEPRSVAAQALREQFRTIAAEGRKYGLFLILCTQRPDKIDPLVLSECENRAIMRLGSKSVLNVAEDLLGLEDVPDSVLSKCLEYQQGRALLVGRWSNSGTRVLYCAMRRTVEGGRNLRAQHWARPQEFGSVAEEPPESERDGDLPTEGEN